MKKQIYITLILFFFICISSCKEPVSTNIKVSPRQISSLIQSITNLMLHDVTNPPLAARFYSYATLAGYEVVSQNNPAFKSMHGILNNYPSFKKPTIKKYSYQIASLFAMIEVAKKMQPSGHDLDSLKKSIFSYFYKLYPHIPTVKILINIRQRLCRD